jgi:hypothetical protein
MTTFDIVDKLTPATLDKALRGEPVQAKAGRGRKATGDAARKVGAGGTAPLASRHDGLTP